MGLPRLTRRLLAQMTVLVIIGAFLFVFKGLSSTLEPWSQAMVNAVAKYTYPKDGQRDATVLLFREENIADLGTHFPIPYAVHADVIEALATYAPRAVFIDFAFINQRPNEDIEVLAQALCNLSQPRDGSKGSKIFIAAPVADNGEISIRRELLRCARAVTPEIKDPSGDSGILTYARGSESEDGFVPTAAFALAGQPEAGSDMEIIWGKGTAPLNRKWMNCSRNSAWQQIRTLAGNPLKDHVNCPYHRTISVSHLLNSSGDDDVEQALSGRTVFYGGDFRFVGDRIESPVYGELPGIYLHAMAYDNLVIFGEHFKRSDRDRWYVMAIDLVQLILAAYFLLAFPPKEEKTAETAYLFVANFGWGLIGILTASAALIVAARIGHMDALCLGMAVAYALIRIFKKKDRGFLFLLFFSLAFLLFSMLVLDLGPRNLLAYFGFFELVRQIQKKISDAHETYEDLKKLAEDNKHQVPNNLLGRCQGIFHRNVSAPFLQWLFSIFTKSSHPPEKALHESPDRIDPPAARHAD